IYPARITFIDPNLNNPTRSAKVRVEVRNPLLDQDSRRRRELYHRLYAEAAVKVDAPDVLAVPRSAVLSPGAQAVVYVDKGGGTYEQRPVRLGRVGDESWEVLDGVGEGERVVTAGNLLMDAHLEKSADLKAARKQFYALSNAVVELAQKLRAQQKEFGSLKVYQCPMLKQAFPGAPSKGLWIQLEGPLRNPYFGAEMIDCGT